jgi:hypothetical protein
MIKDLINSPLRSSTIVASLAALGYIALKGLYRGNEENKYPPGPPQDFLIGCLRHVPQNSYWGTFCEWARRYGMSFVGFFGLIDRVVEIGPVVYVKLPGISLVIVNSYEVAQGVLSTRPNTTAGRRMGYMVKELYVSIPFSNLVLCMMENAEMLS